MGERKKFIISQPPIGETYDHDSTNSWISEGLPSSSRRKRRGEGTVEGGGGKGVREGKCERVRKGMMSSDFCQV